MNKGKETVELPANCGECLFYHPESAARNEGHCHRHAPGPGDHQEEVPTWPRVREGDVCGDGALPDEEAPFHAECGGCVYWHPFPAGFKPIRLQGKTPDWWTETGLCRRWAPSPSREARRHPVEWPVVHARDGCGDGAAPAPETLTGAVAEMAAD